GQRDDRSAARFDFLHVADHFFEYTIVRRYRHDWHPLVDERNRAMLHLAGRIAFGMDVGNLFQLQRTLERDRVVDAAAEVQKIGPRVEPGGDLFDLRRNLQRLLQQQRQLQECVDVRLRGFWREDATDLSEAE